MRKAIYAFSGDPITVGHINIIERAALLFDELVVAIGVNPAKSYLFTLAERQAMAAASLQHLSNVQVSAFTGLLVDYAYEVGATVIVRGARTEADLLYERNLYWLGGSQQENIDTIVLFARQDLAHVSSSAVKEIQLAQGFVQDYVTLSVKQQLEKKISGQYLLGITGEPGVGKNHVAEALVTRAKAQSLEAHHLDLDVLGHAIFEHINEPKYRSLRSGLKTAFGSKIFTSAGQIDRSVLAQLVFTDEHKRQLLNQQMAKPLLTKLRQALFGKRGLIIVNGALLAEFNWLGLVNNQVILVTTSKSQQQTWLQQRGWSAQQISERKHAQDGVAQKQKALVAASKSARFGWTQVFKNEPGNEAELQNLFTQVHQHLYLDSDVTNQTFK